VLIAVLLFRRYLMDYEYIFFPSKALQLALIKTLLMLSLLFVLFWGADRLLALWLNPSYLRSALAYLIPSFLFDGLSTALSRGFDRVIGLR
jgi:hypothetical protein